MGKSFKRNGDYDEAVEDRREKFTKRRDEAQKKKHDHDEAFTLPSDDDAEEDSE